ncbi:MAG: c-type cytochrome [Pseudomonadota bacterium]
MRPYGQNGMFLRILIGCGLVATAFQGAHGQPAGGIGNAEQGRKIAEAECLECHQPDGGGTSASLSEIANSPGMSPLALSVWFNSPHPTMPNFVLSQDTQEDLIAYIQTLKKAD